MISNQKGKIKPEIININSNEPLFHLYIILANKCSGSCNNINDPYAKLCVSDNVKKHKYHSISRTNEKRHIKWHETCKCKCRLDASVCNNIQRCNSDKCRCECRELIDKWNYAKGFI